MEILQTLIRLQEQKRQKNVIPDYVTDVELYNEVISTVKTGESSRLLIGDKTATLPKTK